MFEPFFLHVPGRIGSSSLLCKLHVRGKMDARVMSPPGPGSEAYEHRQAFLDLVLPVDDAVDSESGAVKGRAEATIEQRYSYERLFHGDIRNADAIICYAKSFEEEFSDDEIKDLYVATLALR